MAFVDDFAAINKNISGAFAPPPPPPVDDEFLQGAKYLAEIEASYEARMEHLLAVEMGGPEAISLELDLCASDSLYWANWYAFTYDPRNLLGDPPIPATLPFDFCERQVALWKWFDYLLEIRREGACKKSRGVGFTWQTASYAWHKYRFASGFKTTFGSRKATEVDQIGNPDSILEKVRLLYRGLPRWMLPVGFLPHEHDKQYLLINPENGNTIRGEIGDEIGRGGRSTLMIIDEAAKLDRADSVEASTSANAEVRIWGSTINPQTENNLFQRKYTTLPPDQVFRFHYSEHPIWTPEKIKRKKLEMSDENWAAEFEIDDSFSSEDITIPATWVKAATKIGALLAEKGIKVHPSVRGIVGGDVGGGKAYSVAIARFGSIVMRPISWTNPDTTETALKMLDYCLLDHLPAREDLYLPKVKVLRFDNIAIGQGVQSTLKRNPRLGLIVTGINVGQPASETKWPDGEFSHEKFFNLKAEGWWIARERFKKTHEMYSWLTDPDNPNAIEHPVDELFILIDDPNDQKMERLVAQLSQPKWHRRENGKIQIEDKKSMAKRGLASPDYAEAFILTLVGESKAEKWVQFAKVRV
jgi:phage terminase large subunit